MNSSTHGHKHRSAAMLLASLHLTVFASVPYAHGQNDAEVVTARLGDDAVATELQTRWAALEDAEQRLMAIRDRVMLPQRRAVDVAASLNAVVASPNSPLTAADMELLGNKRQLKAALDNGTASAAVRELMMRLEQADGAFEELQEAFHQFNFDKLKFFIELYKSRVHAIASQLTDGGLRPAQHEQLQQLVDEVDRSFEDYLKKEVEFRRSNDAERLKAQTKFMQAVKAFAKGVDKLTNNDNGRLTSAVEALRRSLDTLQAKGIGALVAISEGSRLHDGRDLFEGANVALQAILANQWVTIDVQNRGILSRPIEPGHIRIVTPNHANYYLDAACIADMTRDLKGRYAVVTAAYHWADKKTAERLSVHPNVVVVSGDPSDPESVRSSKPDQRIKELASQGITTFFILPEGNLPSGFGYEIRPNRETFMTLLKLLRRQGLGIEITPVSMPSNHRFANTIASKTERNHLPVIIHDAIKSSVVDVLLKLGDGQVLNRLIWQHWADDAQATEPSRLIGMPTVRSLAAMLRKHLFHRGSLCELLDRTQNPAIPE